MLLSIDRYLEMTIRAWKFYLTPLRANLVIISLFIIIFGINFNVLLTFGHVEYSNKSEIIQCYTTDIPSTKWMAVWNQVFKLIFYT